MNNRKIIQISSYQYKDEETIEEVVIALCNDGTVWNITSSKQKWIQLPEIPQLDEVKNG